MKLSTICLAGLASANEKKVPPRHPLQRLHRLVEFTEEILHSGAFDSRPTRWINSWEKKFAKNAERMEVNFKRGNQRCGFYDSEMLPHGGPEAERERRDLDFARYDREDPCTGMKQLITGFSKWADRYISNCSGQKNHSHQKKRMTKWQTIMNLVLGCESSIPTTTTLKESTTTAPLTTTSIVSETTTTASCTNGDCYILSGFSDYLWNGHPLKDRDELKLSKICTEDFYLPKGNLLGQTCNDLESRNYLPRSCKLNEATLLFYALESENGLLTLLNCPQCGCSNNNQITLINFNDK